MVVKLQASPDTDKCKAKGLLSCEIGFTKCFDAAELCVYDRDEKGCEQCPCYDPCTKMVSL